MCNIFLHTFLFVETQSNVDKIFFASFPKNTIGKTCSVYRAISLIFTAEDLSRVRWLLS